MYIYIITYILQYIVRIITYYKLLLANNYKHNNLDKKIFRFNKPRVAALDEIVNKMIRTKWQKRDQTNAKQITNIISKIQYTINSSTFVSPHMMVYSVNISYMD